MTTHLITFIAEHTGKCRLIVVFWGMSISFLAASNMLPDTKEKIRRYEGSEASGFKKSTSTAQWPVQPPHTDTITAEGVISWQVYRSGPEKVQCWLCSYFDDTLKKTSRWITSGQAISTSGNALLAFEIGLAVLQFYEKLCWNFKSLVDKSDENREREGSKKYPLHVCNYN